MKCLPTLPGALRDTLVGQGQFAASLAPLSGSFRLLQDLYYSLHTQSSDHSSHRLIHRLARLDFMVLPPIYQLPPSRFAVPTNPENQQRHVRKSRLIKSLGQMAQNLTTDRLHGSGIFSHVLRYFQLPVTSHGQELDRRLTSGREMHLAYLRSGTICSSFKVLTLSPSIKLWFSGWRVLLQVPQIGNDRRAGHHAPHPKPPPHGRALHHTMHW